VNWINYTGLLKVTAMMITQWLTLCSKEVRILVQFCAQKEKYLIENLEILKIKLSAYNISELDKLYEPDFSLAFF
jgi:hypothetical protein